MQSGNRVTIRAMKPTDCAQVCSIIREVWGYHKHASHAPRTAARIVKQVWLEYSMDQTYATVAEQDGRILGLLFGRNDHAFGWKHKLPYLPKRIWNTLLLCLTKPGRRYFKIRRIEHGVDHALLQNHTQEFDGELVLFAVHEQAQGHGIGQLLMTDFQAYMRQTNAKNFYLFTDDYCNVDFYTKRGYTKVETKQAAFRKNGKQAAFYLMEYRL